MKVTMWHHPDIILTSQCNHSNHVTPIITVVSDSTITHQWLQNKKDTVQLRSWVWNSHNKFHAQVLITIIMVDFFIYLECRWYKPKSHIIPLVVIEIMNNLPQTLLSIIIANSVSTQMHSSQIPWKLNLLRQILHSPAIRQYLFTFM